MSTSRFYKKLTQAEVGQTKTHEVYIRMPNDFDYEKFFNNTHIENGSVFEVNFTAPTVSKKNPTIPQQEYDYRFVFFANSNKEKRIPGLGPLFKAFKVEEGDVVCIERIGEGDDCKFNVTFYNSDEIQISPSAVMITSDLNWGVLTSVQTLPDRPLQLICYGAPGTGKSHAIAKETNPRNSVRTTFHPDSDYASFVGAYKPTMEDVDFSYITDGKVKYAQRAKSDDGREHPGTQQKIVYKYVPQAFLKAYVAAWKAYNAYTPYYLIIEEINRGNCAQIFGDLFQLLDRNDEGYSSYPIATDDDIRKFLVSDEKGFKGLETTNPEAYAAISGFEVRDDNGELVINGAEILSGEKLLLPRNLYIWATMNTSDQSLFPIDSAFKRRWNWEYMPIEYDKKDWVIAVGDRTYYWGRFLELINPEIYGLTGSADKQMGYFFAKPDTFDKESNRNVISEKLFINKVLFYLWTDVLKDYDLSKKPFVYEDENHKKKAFVFTDFFGKDATANLLRFFEGIEGLEPAEATEPKDDNNNDFSVTFPDGTVISEPTLTATYMQALKKIGFEEVAKSKANDLKNPLVTREKVEGLEKPRRYNEIDGWFVLVGPDTYPYYKKLELLNNELSLNLDIKHK